MEVRRTTIFELAAVNYGKSANFISVIIWNSSFLHFLFAFPPIFFTHVSTGAKLHI